METSGMNKGTAKITIDIARKILDGKAYELTLTVEQTELFLTWIAQDFGADLANAAARTVLAHVAETSGLPLNNGPQPAIRKLAEGFLGTLAWPALDALLTQAATDLAAAKGLSPQERQIHLPQPGHKPRQITATTTTFLRNQYVVAEVLCRANGQCDQCSSPAPFTKHTDHTPYLEVHHRIPLAKGGDDTVENAIALCPNCHREAHHGVNWKNFRPTAQ